MPNRAARSAIVVPAVRQKAKTMTIGAVLDKLQPEFPDLTVSKIRFLETKELLSPQRTESGYRRYTEAEVERLRYILVAQRDNYLPLKVIRQQLDAMDEGTVTAIVSASEVSASISPDTFRPPTSTRLTDSDVADQAGVDIADVVKLMRLGVIRPDASGYFTADDVKVVTTVGALSEFGVDDRILKSLKNAALRQAGLVAQLASASALGDKHNAQAAAQESGMQIQALMMSLHAVLIKNELRSELG